MIDSKGEIVHTHAASDVGVAVVVAFISKTIGIAESHSQPPILFSPVSIYAGKPWTAGSS